MRYQNFNVVIEGPGGESYTVRAEWRSAEPDPDRILLDRELFTLQQRLADNEGVETALLQEFGERLYKALFAGEAGALFYQSVGYARAAEQGVCLRLCIEPAEAARLPWEFLYWPGEKVLLGGSREFPVVRYVRLARPIDDFKVELPLRMLVAIPDASGLNTEQEEANLRKAVEELERRGLLELRLLKGNVTLSRISDALLKERFHVFHFIGHGEFIDKTAYLRLNLDDGGSYNADDAQICSLFREYRTLKLVFLNSCRGAITSADEAGTGMAPRLVQSGVPAVVAMQYEINDQAAVTFSREFYSALFDGSDRGRVDVAMSHARNVLQREFTGERDIGAPVLYLRASAGMLFDTETAPAGMGLFVPAADRDRIAAAGQTLARNLDIRKQAGAADDPQLLQEKTWLQTLRQRVVRHNTFVSAAAVLAVAFWVWSWMPLINSRVDSYVKGLADFVNPPQLHPDIALVLIQDDTPQRLGIQYDKDRVAPEFRARHAVLLKRLADARARAVVMDFAFTKPDAAFDAAFLQAISGARKQGTAVVVATNEFDQSGKPKMIPGLQEAASAWGFDCTQRDAFGYATAISLAAESRAAAQLRRSLPLAVYEPTFELARVDFEDRAMLLRGPDGRDWRKIRFVEKGSALAGTCGAIAKGDPLASFIVDVLPPEAFEGRRFAYEKLAGDTPEVNLSQFAGKTVFVARDRLGNDRKKALGRLLEIEKQSPGQERARLQKQYHDDIRGAILVREGGRAYAVTPLEWNASILSMLLRGQFVDRISGAPAIMVALVFGVIGAVAGRYHRPGRGRWKALGVDVAWVLGLLMLCMAAAGASYLAFSTLLNAAWCAVVALGGYAAASAVRADWFRL